PGGADAGVAEGTGLGVRDLQPGVALEDLDQVVEALVRSLEGVKRHLPLLLDPADEAPGAAGVRVQLESVDELVEGAHPSAAACSASWARRSATRLSMLAIHSTRASRWRRSLSMFSVRLWMWFSWNQSGYFFMSSPPRGYRRYLRRSACPGLEPGC